MARRFYLAGFIALFCAAPLRAESKTFEITVAAGKHDRRNTPVTVLIRVPAALTKTTVAELQGPDGKATAGQLTASALLTKAKPAGDGELRELHFVLPELKAGSSATFKATVRDDTSPLAQAFSWKDTAGESTELRLGSTPVLRYMYKAIDESTPAAREQTFKVYHHVFDPEGKRLVTKGPGGLYTHHRGLFFGFNKVTYGDGKKCDVWHCTNGAHQLHEKFVASEAGALLGRHRLFIAWNAKPKETFAHEERELTVYEVPGGRLVEFASRVRTTGGPVKLDGDPQHAGFHFRAAQDVAEKEAQKQTYYLRPDGKGKLAETRNWTPKKPIAVNLPWNAMCFVLDGERYTAGYLDRPGNPKEARYSEREYGRFGSYFEYELTEAKPLEVNYRIWLQKGEMQVADMERLDNDFIAPVEVTVK
jgi:hypothetical protein